MQVHQTDFSTGSVQRNIIEVAIPMIAAQLLNLLYNIVDRIYIGRIAGEGTLALTGVGLCFPLITLITAFSLLFGNGGAPLCAIERGKGNEKEAQMLMGNTFSLLLITGAILTGIGLLFYRPILYAFGASDVTFPYAGAYIRIYLLGTVFVMIVLGMNNFLSAQGFGNMSMLTVLLGAVLNIILDPIFIFGFHLGVQGAAIATVISQCCSALWVLKFLTGKRAVLHLTREGMILKLQRVRKIISLGTAGFMMAFTNGLVQVVCNSTLQTFGGDLYVGVMTILNSVREIFNMPIQGLNNGASPVMGFNYGRKGFRKSEKSDFLHLGSGNRLYSCRLDGGEAVSGVFYPDLQWQQGSGRGLCAGASYLFFWLLFYGAAVFPANVCSPLSERQRERRFSPFSGK